MELNEKENQLDLSPTAGQIVTLDSLLVNKEPEVVNKEEELEISPIKKVEKKEEVVIPIDTEAGKNTETVLNVTKDELDLEDKQTIILDEKPSSKYKDIIEKFISLGEFEAFDTLELEDGTEVSFEDADIDEELFESIIKQQSELKKEKLSSGKVDTVGISEFTKKLIEIEKNGGSVAQAVEAYQKVKEPLSNMDTSTLEGKRAVVYMHLKATGQNDDLIAIALKAYEADGLLDSKAEIAESEMNAAYERHIESINQQAIDAKAAQVEALKTYKKDIKESLSTFQINDSFKKKIVDMATSPDESGRYEMDKIYNEKRRDPKEAAEIALFLLDREEYLKQRFEGKVNEEKLNVMKKLKLISKSKDSLNISTKDKKSDSNEISLSRL